MSGAALAPAYAADPFPNKPIRLLVGFAAAAKHCAFYPVDYPVPSYHLRVFMVCDT